MFLNLFSGAYYDNNQDGLEDYADVHFDGDTTNTRQYWEEYLTVLAGPYEFGSASPTWEAMKYKTVLGWALSITDDDKILLRIAENYKPKTQLEDIAGLD